jgi:hypothetical protein
MIGQSLSRQAGQDSIFVGTNPIEVLASAATISPTGHWVRITGNTTIDTINRPSDYFVGPLFIYNTDAAVGTLSTAGNVALGVTLTRFKLFVLIFDPVTNKWYPSNAS